MPRPAGKRNRRITIQRATVTQDPGSGQNIETWATLATVWAEKLDVSDRERLAAAEVQAELTMRFRILWFAAVDDVGPLDRISYGGRIYNIEAVRETGFHAGLEISASARAE